VTVHRILFSQQGWGSWASAPVPTLANQPVALQIGDKTLQGFGPCPGELIVELGGEFAAFDADLVCKHAGQHGQRRIQDHRRRPEKFDSGVMKPADANTSIPVEGDGNAPGRDRRRRQAGVRCGNWDAKLIRSKSWKPLGHRARRGAFAGGYVTRWAKGQATRIQNTA
jgi:hypothetical protein